MAVPACTTSPGSAARVSTVPSKGASDGQVCAVGFGLGASCARAWCGAPRSPLAILRLLLRDLLLRFQHVCALRIFRIGQICLRHGQRASRGFHLRCAAATTAALADRPVLPLAFPAAPKRRRSWPAACRRRDRIPPDRSAACCCARSACAAARSASAWRTRPSASIVDCPACN